MLADEYLALISNLLDVQSRCLDIHPLLMNFYPIAVFEDGYLFVYEYEDESKSYKYKCKIADTNGLTKGVKAAFRLEEYDNKSVCIISAEIFDSLEGYVYIFHEFVHCYQLHVCVDKIKNKLRVFQEQIQNQNFSWEINYLFPYQKPDFEALYSSFLSMPNENAMKDVSKIRLELRSKLSVTDYEYMIWQEWMEGFARYIENKIRKRLNIKENTSGINLPFSRTSFYTGGEKYIKLAISNDPNLEQDIEKLFYYMLNIST